MASGRKYVAPLTNATVTNDSDQDIFELAAGSGIIVVVHEIQLNSATTTDERVQLVFKRRTVTGNGSVATCVALDPGNTVAAESTVDTLSTTPSDTSQSIMHSFYWSQLSPFIWLPTPETQIIVPPSGFFAVNLRTAVASSRNWSGYIVFEEIG